MGIKHVLLCLFLLNISYMAKAQEPVNWQDLEKAIAGKENLLTVRAQLDQIQQQARQRNDQATIGRTWLYLLAITDATTEDTLFFKNALFLDSIGNNQ
jgi:hypothetical protein